MSDQNDTNTTSPTTINPVTSQDDQTPQPIIPTNPAASATPDVSVDGISDEALPTISAMPDPDYASVPADPILEETPPKQFPNESLSIKTNQPESNVAKESYVAPVDNSSIIGQIATKVAESNNILIALSSNPSVDEMSSAIGLSLFLNRIGKQVTAIYSGTTPNALEFLKPEETFEQSADILQDFVIALNKEKADHLRYKVDGDYVKIFITPYHSKISSEDLEFSYGDFNVDLVIALDVANGVDLDSALREHGRIMHDAVVINITTGNPGKLGEIEWSDKTASSVSEMIVELLYGAGEGDNIEQSEATAFLTGIVAATNRFANASTTPKTMEVASRLMKSGANQQLISSNITPDVNNELFNSISSFEKENDPTELNVKHGDVTIDNIEGVDNTSRESALLDDLKTAEASLANAAAEVTPDVTREPLRIEGNQEIPMSMLTEPTPVLEPVPASAEQSRIPEPSSTEPTPIEPTPIFGPTPTMNPTVAPTMEPLSGPEPVLTEQPNNMAGTATETVITPSADFNPNSSLNEGTSRYGQMLEDTLASSGPDNPEPTAPIINPTSTIVPEVASKPEINGVPEINYMPMPGDEILPPPPTPPINFDATTPENSLPTPNLTSDQNLSMPAQNSPASAPATPLGPQPAMQDQVYNPQASNPGAFKIPGM